MSNGRTRATVSLGAGRGIVNAILQAVFAARTGTLTGEGRRWAKLDIVQDVQSFRNFNLSSPLPFDASLYGIALDRLSGAAFLPEELVSAEIVGHNHRIDPGNLLALLREGAGRQQVADLLRSGKLNVYRFGTTSVVFDGSSTFPLYRGHRMFTEVSKEELLDALRLSGRYLSRAVNQEGKFAYIYEPSVNDVRDDYNIIRHAGTILAMLELYQLTGDQELLNAGRRAINYLLRQAQPCPLKTEDTMCIVENGNTKLGGNALAALALAEYTTVTGDRSSVPVLLLLGNSIRSFQKESGEFFVQKLSVPAGKITSYESDYYPGEALFALTRIYKIDPSAAWLEAAEKGARYRIRHGRWPWA